jgi:hypothetical protein
LTIFPIAGSVLVAAFGAIGCLLFSGCSWSIGGGKERTLSTTHPTRGQELIDLKKARDQGAITEAEYQAQKTKLVEK